MPYNHLPSPCKSPILDPRVTGSTDHYNCNYKLRRSIFSLRHQWVATNSNHFRLRDVMISIVSLHEIHSDVRPSQDFRRNLSRVYFLSLMCFSMVIGHLDRSMRRKSLILVHVPLLYLDSFLPGRLSRDSFRLAWEMI